MDGSSKKFSLLPLTEECYPTWSRKMKRQLIFKGLWPIVKRGYEKPQIEQLDSDEMEILQKAMTNDAKALSLIRQSLTPPMFMKVMDAKSAKQAWDKLQVMFQKKAKGKMEEAPKAKTTNECTNEVMNNSPAKASDKSFTGEEANGMPLSGDKPFFDLCLVKTAVLPSCILNFPMDANHMLPENNVPAKVKCFGKVYDIKFLGEGRQKRLASGWRQVVCEHDLSQGDFVVFEIVESNNSRLEINLQVLRNVIPPELEEEVRKREAGFVKIE